MTLFERVKKISDKRGFSSLRVLSEDAGLSPNVVYGWKTKKPSSQSLEKVAKVLNVSTDYLLGNTDEMMPNKKDTTNEPVDNSIEGIKARLVSYDGSPVTDHDAKVIKQFLDAYYAGKDE